MGDTAGVELWTYWSRTFSWYERVAPTLAAGASCLGAARMAGRMGVARARLEAARTVLENIFRFARLRCAAVEVCIVGTSIVLQRRIYVDWGLDAILR